jgi:hypothetical protein
VRLGEKAIACLRIADALHGEYLDRIAEIATFGHIPPSSFRERSALYDRLYAEACARWSAKAVARKQLELCHRRYLEFGVSLRTAWLTEKGRRALAENLGRCESRLADGGDRDRCELERGHAGAHWTDGGPRWLEEAEFSPPAPGVPLLPIVRP